MLKALNGEQLQFLIGLHLWRDRLPCALTHLDLERTRIGHPSARGVALEELGDRRQRLRLPVQLVQ